VPAPAGPVKRAGRADEVCGPGRLGGRAVAMEGSRVAGRRRYRRRRPGAALDSRRRRLKRQGLAASAGLVWQAGPAAPEGAAAPAGVPCPRAARPGGGSVPPGSIVSAGGYFNAQGSGGARAGSSVACPRRRAFRGCPRRRARRGFPRRRALGLRRYEAYRQGRKKEAGPAWLCRLRGPRLDLRPTSAQGLDQRPRPGASGRGFSPRLQPRPRPGPGIRPGAGLRPGPGPGRL
jgi:hypothetical protein